MSVIPEISHLKMRLYIRGIPNDLYSAKLETCITDAVLQCIHSTFDSIYIKSIHYRKNTYIPFIIGKLGIFSSLLSIDKVSVRKHGFLREKFGRLSNFCNVINFDHSSKA